MTPSLCGAIGMTRFGEKKRFVERKSWQGLYQAPETPLELLSARQRTLTTSHDRIEKTAQSSIAFGSI